MDNSDDSISQWLHAARAGSHDALGHALEACRVYLLMVAEREMDPALRGKGGASDLVQETFLEAQRAFPRFLGDSEEELLAWLRRLLLNNVTDFRRRYRDTDKRNAEREVGLQGDTSSRDWAAFLADDVGGTPSGELAQQEDLALLQQAMAALPDDYRQVLQLRYLENLPFEEIGSRMGRTSMATRKLFGRAVERLQRELEGPTSNE